MLIILSGLPGTGKTSIAHLLVPALGAVHVRIDTIEHALRTSGKLLTELDDAGYRVGYAIAEGNLRLGLPVVADSVNPLGITRAAWRQVAARAGAPAVEVEVICSDAEEHRRRIETRTADLEGFRLPTWREVLERRYEPWDRDHTVIDTAGRTAEQSVATLRANFILADWMTGRH
ncbi:MAG TPA: AAA family ATPase [Vicinamibacterales bacterium]|nr:AAA family ATPase [Vicinamibacterales bacterium]